jgi:prophage regulatory protein
MDRLLRIKDICGDKSAGVRGYLPISKSAWWAGVAKGKFPSPVKLGTRTTCWRETDVMAVVNGNQASTNHAT